jgi:hypothetical protein
MRSVRRLPLVVLSLLLLLPAVLPVPSAAQDKDTSLESLLPAETLAYASWRGAAGMTAHQSTNALLQLWNDPDLAPARALMASGMFSDAKDMPPLTNDDVTLLAGNPALAALIKLPAGVKPHDKPQAAKPATPSPGEIEAAIVLIYDRAGREKLTERLMQWSSEGKAGATITKTSFHGMDVLETKSGTDVTYRTLAGHYLVQSDYREVLEHWATRLASGAPGRGTLADTAEYHAARTRVGPDAAVMLFVNLRAWFDQMRSQMKE